MYLFVSLYIGRKDVENRNRNVFHVLGVFQ